MKGYGPSTIKLLTEYENKNRITHIIWRGCKHGRNADPATLSNQQG